MSKSDTTGTVNIYAKAIDFRKNLKVGEIKIFNGYKVERQSSQYYRINDAYFVKGAYDLQQEICKPND